MDDDGANSSAGGSQKDKGRGSYKCGRVSENDEIGNVVVCVHRPQFICLIIMLRLDSVEFQRRDTFAPISPS